MFFSTLMVRGFQLWQMEDVIVVEYAIDQINSLHTEDGIIFFVIGVHLFCSNNKGNCRILGFPEDNVHSKGGSIFRDILSS